MIHHVLPCPRRTTEATRPAQRSSRRSAQQRGDRALDRNDEREQLARRRVVQHAATVRSHAERDVRLLIRENATTVIRAPHRDRKLKSHVAFTSLGRTLSHKNKQNRALKKNRNWHYLCLCPGCPRGGDDHAASEAHHRRHPECPPCARSA